VCLGLPGALPVPNRRAIELAITAGLALHCSTPEHTKFDRKNYMYPDLPKGYQISQYDLPLSVNGWVALPGGKRVRIRRAHLEEDTGTLKHGEDGGRRYTLVDFNRSGVPLLEIVSEPDLSSTEEAEQYVRTLREMLIFAGVSDVRFEEGAGRFDVNVSIRFSENGKTEWPPQSEIKNLNSYQAMREAVAFEADRLWSEWRAGGDLRTRKGKITVGWSPERRWTYLQRTKEEVEDYRYFPEPDLVALEPDPAMVENLRRSLPEMPTDRRARYVKEYGLSDYDARNLVADPKLAEFFEATVKLERSPKAIAKLVMGEIAAALKRDGTTVDKARISPDQLADIVRMLEAGRITNTAAKEILAEVWQNGGDPEAIANTMGFLQVTDETAIAEAVDAVIRENAKAAADYRKGNDRALGALVGAVRKRLGSGADLVSANRILLDRLKE
jgi:aspartyl-tRNA(Asn)/glutamyl-tRNA(Gln) amidotransferase subunit B